MLRNITVHVLLGQKKGPQLFFVLSIMGCFMFQVCLYMFLHFLDVITSQSLFESG